MRFIYGLLSAAIGLGLLYLLKTTTGIEATSFSIFFIIPIGAMFIAYFMGSGYPYGVIKANKKASKAQLRFVLISSIIAYVLIQLMYYKMTFMSSDMVINYTGSGDHISEFYLVDSGKQLTFWNFFVYKVNTTSISFTRRSINSFVGPVSFSFLNWVFKAIEFFMFIVAYVSRYSITINKHEYCDDCGKYMETENITRFTTDQSNKMKQLLQTVQDFDIEGAKRLIEENPPKTQKPTEETMVEGQLYFCKECNKGYISFDIHKRNSKGNYPVNKTKEMLTPLTSDFVKGIL